MNRLSRYLEEPPEQEYGDFYVVAGEFGAACVTYETARDVEAMLDRWWVPTWIEFRDRVGSRIRVRSRHIRSIGESRRRSVSPTGASTGPASSRSRAIAVRGRTAIDPPPAPGHHSPPRSPQPRWLRIGTHMKIFGQHDEQTIVQFQHVRERAVDAALMADGHVGYVMPIGGVAAYRDQVSVVGVGFDIACGNAAIRTDLTLEGLTGIGVVAAASNPHRIASNPVLNEIADEIQATVSFGIGRKNRADDAPVDDPLFLDPAWWAIPNTGGFRDTLMEKARRQLGTVGSGNHYVDVFHDETGRIWVGVHFGSRGLGFTIASNFLAISQGGRWGDRAREVEVLLDVTQGAGHDYWHLMNLAGRYAYAGREWVARKVVQILGGREVELVHNHHNFAWKETHGGEEVVVVRKGATPAFPGQLGFIGGSMGDDAVIVRGTLLESATPEVQAVQREALYSTVHGAGRVMSRTQAAGKRNRKTGRIISPGRVTPEMMREWVEVKGVVLRGGGLDESPHVYRRLPEVLTAQEGTVEVLHTLRPLIVVMAGAEEFDPYKD